MGEEHRIVRPGVLENIPDICDFVVATARQAGLNERAVYHCQMAVDEACTNIVEHGYQSGLTGDDIEVICCDEGDIYSISVLDKGPPFNPLGHEDPDPARPLDDREPGGWGIYFIKKMMDHARYTFENGRNRLTMVKAKHPQNIAQVQGASGDRTIITRALTEKHWEILPDGRLDSTGAPPLEAVLEAQLNAGHIHLIINMQAVTYISTSGLKVLVNAWRHARDMGGDVILAGMVDHVFEVFETIGFDQIFSIYDTLDETLRVLGL